MTRSVHPVEAYEPLEPYPPRTANLADILERILDKGVVIAGDIKIDLLDIELLTIRIRLFISSVDTARKAGIDWWETEPASPHGPRTTPCTTRTSACGNG